MTPPAYGAKITTHQGLGQAGTGVSPAAVPIANSTRAMRSRLNRPIALIDIEASAAARRRNK